MHRVGLITTSNPVISSLKNNYTVFVVEFETDHYTTACAVTDLDLLDLSLLLLYLKALPVVIFSLHATISSIVQNKLEFEIDYLIDS
jgi:hypothetical protein